MISHQHWCCTTSCTHTRKGAVQAPRIGGGWIVERCPSVQPCKRLPAESCQCHSAGSELLFLPVYWVGDWKVPPPIGCWDGMGLSQIPWISRQPHCCLCNGISPHLGLITAPTPGWLPSPTFLPQPACPSAPLSPTRQKPGFALWQKLADFQKNIIH